MDFGVWPDVIDVLLDFLTGSLVGAALEALLRGLGGVFGGFGVVDLTGFGEAFGAVAVLLVDIAVGLLFVGDVFSTGFVAASFGLDCPFVVPFDAAGFLLSTSAGLVVGALCTALDKGSFFCAIPPSCLSASMLGVSIADSGIVSSTTVLFFRASNSPAMLSFRCCVATG